MNVGQTATFTVVATGAAPLSYQWQKNQVNIAGATSASYTTPATTSADNGTAFRVIVTNPVTSVTSNAATLTVNAGPSITTQPANQTVNVGQTATFTVVATGAAPLSYQWQKNQVNIAGATSASYTTPATTSADNGTSFRVIVTNPVTSVTSNAATLTVNAGPSITTQPANQTVNVGQTATFTVVAIGARSPELSVAEEPGKYRRSDIRELHDAGDDKRGQRNELPGDRDEPGHERDEQCGDIDGERGTEHHDAASQSDGECRSDGDVHGGRDRRPSVELSVAEEPGQYRQERYPQATRRQRRRVRTTERASE